MSMISTNDIQALINTQVAPGIIEGAINESAVLKYFRRLPDMTSNQTKLAVLDKLPLAYWQTSNTSFKKLTTMAWKDKYIVPEELAVIVTISENELADTGIDLWSSISARIKEAFGKKIDEAIVSGIDKPLGFRMSLIDSAINSGSTVTESDDLYKDLNSAMALVEESDYNPNAVMGGAGIKSAFRMLVDSTGQPIRGTEIDSIPKLYMTNGAWNKSRAKLIVGDFSQAVYSIRQDISFKILTEASIHDPTTGEMLYNLPQQDLIAIRATMRLGWEIPNPVTSAEVSNGVRFPFSVIVPSSPETQYNVTFTVKDDASTPVAIEGAVVDYAGQEKVTDSTGKAVFKQHANTKSKYTVTALGKQKVSGKVEVATSAKSVNVTMLAVE